MCSVYEGLDAGVKLLAWASRRVSGNPCHFLPPPAVQICNDIHNFHKSILNLIPEFIEPPQEAVGE